MEDEKIIELLLKRDENVLGMISEKYNGYCSSIAYNILGNQNDAEECVNEALFNVWNSIPPSKPSVFSAYIGKCTRFAALKKLRDNSAKKRGGGEASVAFDELSECFPSDDKVFSEIETKETGIIINTFLGEISEKERRIFICRYWYFDSIADISKRFGFSQSKVKSMLFRTRKKLKQRLEKEGVFYE